MDQVRLGATGLHVSRVCLGMMSYGNDSDRPWVLDEEAAEPIIRRAVEAGITFFDTADVYSRGASEVATGRARPEVPLARRGRDRDEGPRPDDARPERRAASRASTSSPPSTPRCERLGMDYVDLYQIHRWDPQTPIEETMEALHDVVRAGKARYIGASSMHAWQFAKAQHVAERHGWTRFVSMQNHVQPPLPRGGARDDPAVHRPGRRRHPLEPAGPRLPHRHAHARGRAAHHARGDRRLPGQPLRPPGGLRRHRPPQRGGGRALRLPGAGGAGVAAAQAGHHRADRRRHQARAPRGGHRRRQPVADRARRSSASRSPTCPTRCSGTSSRRGGPAPSPQETWDALFSEFYLRAYADEEADADAGAQAREGGAAGGLPARRRPARRALRLRPPLDPAGARRLPRHRSRQLADAAGRGPAPGRRPRARRSSRPTTASCPSPSTASTPR